MKRLSFIVLMVVVSISFTGIVPLGARPLADTANSRGHQVGYTAAYAAGYRTISYSTVDQDRDSDRRDKDKDKVKVPEDYRMRVELLSSISTKENKEGDTFTARVLTPEDYRGAVVEGHIGKIKPAKRAGGSSELSLAFDKITLDKGAGPSGRLSAQIEEVYEVENSGKIDEEGKVQGKSVKKSNAVKIGGGAAAGALIGGILGGGSGAAIGAGVGAAVGATTALASKGKDMEFPTGTELVIRTASRDRR